MTLSDLPSATQRNDLSQFFDDLPCPDPLPETVAAGVFGALENGFHFPSDEEIRALTEEHAREMVVLLADQSHLEQCLERGIDPKSQRKPRNAARQQQLQTSIAREIEQLAKRYQCCVDVYVDGFGYEAAEQLDAAAHRFVDGYCRDETLIQRQLF